MEKPGDQPQPGSFLRIEERAWVRGCLKPSVETILLLRFWSADVHYLKMADENLAKFILIKKRKVLCENLFKSSRYSDLPSVESRSKKRKRLLLALSAIILYNPPIDRLVWMLPRTDHWYSIVQTKLSDKEWYENFRVSRETFDYILAEISTEISHEDTKLHKAVPSAKRLAITLYYLGSTAEYRTVANLFGVSNAFVCLCVKEVSKSIFKKMKKRFLSLPKNDDLKNVMEMYKQRWGFPMCAGAVDGTHIPIQAPSENHADYVNRKVIIA